MLPLRDGFDALPWRCLWHAATRTIILSDLHLGAEETLARQGIYLPGVWSRAIDRAWGEALALGPARVVMAGDVFDTPDPTPRAIEQLGRMLGAMERRTELAITPGNHDPDPGRLMELCGGRARVEAAVWVKDYVVTHGHAIAKELWQGARGLIVGHQHPAVVLATRVRSAKMICFAHFAMPRARERAGGGGEAVIVLPAFSPLPLGSNLLTERNWLLDLPRPAPAEVRIAGIIDKEGAERVLDFGPLSGLG